MQKVGCMSPQYCAVFRRCQTCHNSSLSQMFEIYWHVFARSEVLVTTLVESRNFRDVTPCRVVNSCLRLDSPRVSRPKDGGRKPLWNWVILSSDRLVSQDTWISVLTFGSFDFRFHRSCPWQHSVALCSCTELQFLFIGNNNSTCFGQSFCPSSGAFQPTTALVLLTCCKGGCFYIR